MLLLEYVNTCQTGEVPELPSVVIVGRPNVGKSTLFNAILGTRRPIVGDEPGITRDRIYGEGQYLGRPFELIDTGGIIENDDDLIPSEILKQARVALEKAACVIFLVDGRAEITGADRDLAKMLRKLGKPVVVAVNKIDTPKSDNLIHEFRRLGFTDLFVSAEQRIGLDGLLEHVTRDVPEAEAKEPESKAESDKLIKVAIIGRPNVGKSTLLNALTGSSAPSCRRSPARRADADETIEHAGVEYQFVDTAGIRRKKARRS